MSSIILRTTPQLPGVAFRNDSDLGRDHNPSTNSTLNEKYAIHSTTPITPGTRMAIRYYCIGNGALRAEPNAIDQTINLSSVHHRPINAALYNMLPFVVKHETEDLTVGERADYAMRVPLLISGEWYWAYYLRLIDVGTSENLYSEITVANGVVTTRTPYVYTSANLSPTKPDFNINEAVPSEGNFYEVVRPLDISFSATDSQRFTEALEIIYGDASNKGVVSELGMVAGYANTVSLLNTSKAPVAGSYTECLKSIITDICNLDPTNFSSANEGIDFTIDLGSTIPKSEQAI